MHLLIVSATAKEIAPLERVLKQHFVPFEEDTYQRGELQVSLLRTGVGLPLTAFALGQVLAVRRFDLAIQAGIAGALNRELELGEVVQVVAERFADLGVEERDGRFTDVYELDLIPADQAPFQQGWLHNEAAAQFDFLPKARGVSVNIVHGHAPSIEAFRNKYRADVETMEGASFFYACLLKDQPFLEIRAISNYVEARDRSNWKVAEAIDSLNQALVALLNSFQAFPEKP